LKQKYTVGGLFSGVGGIELGFEKSGFNVLWANEIDKNSCLTYRNNFSHQLIEGDIKNIKGKDLKSVDILCGGFPCQPFSIAGYRKGFDDDRGNVFFEIIRLVNELKRKPKVLFLENVKNFKSHDQGKTFQTVVNIIKEQGYSVFFDVLNTSDFTKIPQNRERTFLICFKDEVNWKSLNKTTSMSYKFSHLFPPKKVKSNKPITDFLETKEIPENFYYRQDKYMYTELRKMMKSKETLYQWRRQYVRENKNNKCPTLTANMGTGGHNVPLVVTDDGFRKLTPRECFNFQGFPKTFKFPKDMANSHLYKQAGNAVTVDMITVLAKKIHQVIK
jgi:DNA (cytosine-5)-methyltransferase 1|tara:strand:+ start:1026 stop:2018 length:993 start_codon:yes stop_codon:yes gene_type:complete